MEDQSFIDIAVVDSDQYSREVIQNHLKTEGYRVKGYGDGLSFLNDYDQQVQLLILGVNLPDISGFKVCQILKEKDGEGIPIIMLTIQGDDASKKRCHRLGCDDFLTKPINKIELMIRVKNLIRMKEMFSQLRLRESITRQFCSDKNDNYHNRKDKKILIIEDNQSDQELYEAFLGDEFRLSFASTGREALEKLQEEFFNLVILDFYLPEIDGISLYKKFPRDQTNLIPVLMVTSNTDTLAKAESFELGINEYMTKPINRLELTARIKSLLRSAEKHKNLVGNYNRAAKSATTDSMTGLYNNKYFKEYLRKEIKNSRQTGFPLVLLMLDMDNFKEYNDTNGHLQGDRALKEIAGIIVDNIRISDLAARYGGEEFAMVLAKTTLDKGLEIAERIRKIIENHHFFGEEKMSSSRLTASIGAAELRAGEEIDFFINRADQALYTAKDRGKNRIAPGGEGFREKDTDY